MLSACGGGGEPSASAPPSESASETTTAPASPASLPPGQEQIESAPANADGKLPGYYVDAATGDDSNPGTVAAPFKSFARLLSVRLASGEGIYLHCGSVWREALNLGFTQLVDGSKISVYGTGCGKMPPRITGSDDFSGQWTLGANGVWSRSVPAGTPKIARLFINGTPLRTAQWPNDDVVAHASTTAAPSRAGFTASTTDAAMLANKDLAGATAHLSTEPWTVESVPVNSFSAATGHFTLGSATVFAEPAGGGYVLQDKLWMLDAPGEFFHDTTHNVLYMIPPSSIAPGAVNSSAVEGAVRDGAVTLGQRRSLDISGLAIDMTRKDGFVLNDAPNALVSNISSSHHARGGMRIFSTTPVVGNDRNANISSSVFSDNQIIGVDAINANRVTLKSSSVSDTGMIGWPGTALAGVWLADGGVLTGSTVSRSAYNGVRFSGTDGSTVTSNDVNDYCLRLGDCGGIYTWNGPKGSSKTENQVSRVAGNRLKSTITSASPAAVAGIYLDDYSMGTTVRNNTITGGQYGVLIHNGSNHVIDSNRLWLNTKASLWATMDQTDANWMNGNTIIGNQFVPLSSANGTFPALPHFQPAYAVQFWSSLDGIGSVANGSNKFTGNQYINVHSSSVPPIQALSSGTMSTYTTGQWHKIASTDGTLRQPAAFALVNTTTGGEMQAGGTFDNGLAGWNVWYAPPQTGTLNATAPHLGCAGTCAQFTATSVNDTIWGQPYSMTSGAMYVARMSVAFDSDATILPPYISMASPPNNTVYDTDGKTYINGLSGATGDSLDTETFFHANGTMSARTGLKIRTPNAPVAFDNVSVKQVTGYTIPSSSSWIAEVQAPAGASATISCSTLGWGGSCQAMAIDGTPIALPETLPAGSTQLLMRANSPLRR
jgi:parallel beta-helix repeat protein